MKRQLLGCLCFVCICCLFLFSVRPVQAFAPPRPVRRSTTAKPVKPFSIERIISKLQEVARKEIPEAALIRKINQAGVDFVATPLNLSRLTWAGASPAMLDAVQHLAPAPPEPPPPAPKQEPTGAIDVTCSPAECSVRLGTSNPVTTTDGRLVRRGFKHGSVAVEVTKEGFLPFRSSVMVQGEIAPVRVGLQPDMAIRRMWGTQLKEKMTDSLGGQGKLLAAHSYLAFGDATIWGKGGVKTSCSVEAFIRSPDKAFFRTRAGKKSTFEIDLLPTFRSKSSVSEEEARNLETGLRLYEKYQVFELLKRLNTPGIQLSSPSAGLRDGAELQAQTSTEKDTIFLDADGRPKEIREDVPFGEGVRAFYSAYKPRAGVYFPEKVTIVYAGLPKQGIEIQFHDIAVNPVIKNEGDYRLKKR